MRVALLRIGRDLVGRFPTISINLSRASCNTRDRLANSSWLASPSKAIASFAWTSISTRLTRSIRLPKNRLRRIRNLLAEQPIGAAFDPSKCEHIRLPAQDFPQICLDSRQTKLADAGADFDFHQNIHIAVGRKSVSQHVADQRQTADSVRRQNAAIFLVGIAIRAFMSVLL